MISDLRNQPELAEIVADRIWHAFWRSKGYPLSFLDGLVRESFGPRPIPTTFVAHDDGSFLGTVAVIACDEDTRPQCTPWVAALWVEPEHRRQGIGAALVDKAAAFAFDTGLKRAYLLSGPHRRSYYEALGWFILEEMGDGMVILARDKNG